MAGRVEVGGIFQRRYPVRDYGQNKAFILPENQPHNPLRRPNCRCIIAQHDPCRLWTCMALTERGLGQARGREPNAAIRAARNLNWIRTQRQVVFFWGGGGRPPPFRIPRTLVQDGGSSTE